jgi:hypothetical protein
MSEIETNRKVIGIGAMARVGKDTLAKMLSKLAKEDGYEPFVLSLAWALKKDLEFFIQSMIGVSVWTENTEEKTLIRDILVAYGKAQRKKTEGRYWTSLVEKQIKKIDSRFSSLSKRVYIIPDIRYDEYPEDELFWLKKRMHGTMVFLDRLDENGDLFLPANKDEELNAPRVFEGADARICWPDFNLEIDHGSEVPFEIPPNKEAEDLWEWIKNK